jgi:hypothetical protein
MALRNFEYAVSLRVQNFDGRHAHPPG